MTANNDNHSMLGRYGVSLCSLLFAGISFANALVNGGSIHKNRASAVFAIGVALVTMIISCIQVARKKSSTFLAWVVLWTSVLFVVIMVYHLFGLVIRP